MKRSTLCKPSKTPRRLTCGFVNRLDRAGMLQACDRLLKPERKPRRGELASSLALAFGTALCLIAIESQVVQIDTAQALTTKKSIITVTPKAYAKALLNDNKQYKCIVELYNRESNWRPEARNGSHYGIPQLRNEIMLSKNPLQQIDLGVKYIAHRYGLTANNKPNVCKALHHLKTKGWH
jgi:hypothetical protein